MTRDVGPRRESQSVIHGALQIAGSVAGDHVMCAVPRDSADPDPGSYSRQNSRGSLSLQGTGGDDDHEFYVFLFAGRRGSSAGVVPCMSKRGSVCEYTGGQVMIN